MSKVRETVIDGTLNEDEISTTESTVSPIMKQVQEFNSPVEVDEDDQIDILSAQIINIFKNREIN